MMNMMVDGEDRDEFLPETPESLARKAKILYKWIGEARHVVFFTGPKISGPAGVSVCEGEETVGMIVY